MGKKNLECQYCASIITEKDTTCPKCGANCSNVIIEYKEEREKEEEQKKKEIADTVSKTFKSIGVGFGIHAIIIGVIAFAFIIMIGFIIAFNLGSFNRKKENVTGTINETIRNDEYSIEIDEFEAYEYYDDFFNECNTKSDYQKVAFHFVIKNLTGNTISTRNIVYNMDLKAGDELLEQSSLKADPNFCQVLQGKQEYNKLPSTNILEGDKVSGYVGFQVPINQPKLKFIIDDNLTIEMDNPFYVKH